MASAKATAPAKPTPEESKARLAQYFTLLAPCYNRWTGHATRDIFHEVLNQYGTLFGIDGLSIINDNAAGPGTATEALVNWCKSQGMSHMPTVIATDSVPAMVTAFDKFKPSQGSSWQRMSGQLMDSQELSFRTDTFTHCICNFSVFAFADPVRALSEIHRTLKPKGLAILTTWKRFGVANVMHDATIRVRGKERAGSAGTVGPEFLEDGYLANLVHQAGWERGKVRTLETSLVIKAEADLNGLDEFMKGDITRQARVGWSEEETAAWPAAVDAALAAETETHGGIYFEAWVVVARKWDQLSA